MGWPGKIFNFLYFRNLPFDIASWISFISNTSRWNNKLLNPLVRAWEGNFLLGWKVKFPYESVLWIDFSTKTVKLHNTLIKLHNGVYYDIISSFFIKVIECSNWEPQFNTLPCIPTDGFMIFYLHNTNVSLGRIVSVGMHGKVSNWGSQLEHLITFIKNELMIS